MDNLTGDNIGQLAYLVLLGTAVAGWFFAQNRQSMGKTAQQLLIWAMIFLGVIGAVGLWPQVRQTIAPSQTALSGDTISLPRQSDGHYYLIASVNDVPVEFVVDTGASQVVLTQDDARRVGLDPDTLAYVGSAQTANGTVNTARVWLETIKVNDITDTNLRAVVNQSQMHQSLLGMTYLSRFSKIEIAN